MFLRTSRIKWPARFVVAGIIVALAMLAGMTILTYYTFQQAEIKLAIDRNRQLTFLSAYRLQSEFAKYSQTLMDLSRSKAIQSNLPDLQRSALRQADYRLADFDGGVLLLDNFGKVIASEPVRLGALDQDWSDKYYFRQLLNTKSIIYSNSVNDGPNGEPVVTVSVPIVDGDGQFSGALVGMFRLGQQTISPFYASIVRLRLGETGTTILVDGEDTVLFDSTSSLVGKTYSGWESGIPTVDFSGAERITTADNREIVISYSFIPGTPWKLVIEENWNIVISPVQKYINLLFGLMVIGIVIPTAGLGYLLHLSNKIIGSHTHYVNDMQVARQMKQTLLPKHVPRIGNWNLTIYYKPAVRVSGDYYDFMVFPDGRIMVALAEVTGNGVAAMMVLSSLRIALRGASQRLLSPQEALECSNSLICPELRPHQIINCVYAILDPDKSKLEFACAGENFVYRVNGTRADELAVMSPPLGQSLDSVYYGGGVEIPYGEKILFCSHGVVSVSNKKGDLFGINRLKELLICPNENDSALVNRIVEDLHRFSGRNWENEEDITILLLERDSES